MKHEPGHAAAANTAAFFRLMENRLKFRLFLLQQLPAAYFAGLAIREANEERCAVSVPFNWFTKNPFRSTYFACLGMAAEMSTGALVMAQVYRRRPRASMLITGMGSSFHKKATGRTVFTCAEGSVVRDAVNKAYGSGEAQVMRLLSVGRNNAGEVVAEFWFEWSVRVRQ